MLDVTGTLAQKTQERVRSAWRNYFQQDLPHQEDIMLSAIDNALSIISGSDALYHNQEHTVHVTLTGLAILEGRMAAGESVSSERWMECIVSCVYHDIGIVRGAIQRDKQGTYYTGVDDQSISPPVGSSDASMLPYHVDRGKCYIDEHYADQADLDLKAVKENIERTRFPIPATKKHQRTNDEAGLVRAADLIGQLADPRYLQKLNALFWEFEETGLNATAGYKNPDDVRASYQWFYNNMVAPYIGDGIEYLEMTPGGRKIAWQLRQNYTLASQGG